MSPPFAFSAFFCDCTMFDVYFSIVLDISEGTMFLFLWDIKNFALAPCADMKRYVAEYRISHKVKAFQ